MGKFRNMYMLIGERVYSEGLSSIGKSNTSLAMGKLTLLVIRGSFQFSKLYIHPSKKLKLQIQ